MQKSEELGNQQETIDPAEAGWLAGFLDGEGSITFGVRKKHKGYLGMDLKVLFCNTDAGIITKATRILEKMGIIPHIQEKVSQPGKIWLKPDKTAIYLNLHKQAHIYRLLIQLEPHLAGEKKYRAKLVIQLLEKRIKRVNSHSRSKGDSRYDTEDWWLLREMYRSRGRNAPKELEDRIPRDYTPDNAATLKIESEL